MLLAGAVGSGSVLLLLSTAQTTWHVYTLLAVGGASNGFTQPATNVAMTGSDLRRQGLSFGVKCSSVPLASVVAGAAVPVVTMTHGWRATFLVAGCVGLSVATAAVALLPSAPRRAGQRRARDERDVPRSSLVLLSVAAGTGTAAATSLGAFLVPGGVTIVMELSSAAWVMSACGVLGIGARLLAGLTDVTRVRPLQLMVVMLGLGAVGFTLLTLSAPAAFAAGVPYPRTRSAGAGPACSTWRSSASARTPHGAPADCQHRPDPRRRHRRAHLRTVVAWWGWTSAWAVAAAAAALSTLLVLAVRMRIVARQTGSATSGGGCTSSTSTPSGSGT